MKVFHLIIIYNEDYEYTTNITCVTKTDALLKGVNKLLENRRTKIKKINRVRIEVVSVI